MANHSLAATRRVSSAPMQLTTIARRLSAALAEMPVGGEVTHIYNPYGYAWQPSSRYLRRYGTGTKRALLVGMNPGPFGMAQTGVPFGDVPSVRDFLHIDGRVEQPAIVHPARPIDGFACPRREVSGRRLWEFVAEQFGSAEAFFADYFVYNYCPLAFMASSGKNITPADLPTRQRARLEAACDAALRASVAALEVEWVLGIGGFAASRCRIALAALPDLRFGQLLHPSPANPLANRGWAQQARAQLQDLGLPLGRKPRAFARPLGQSAKIGRRAAASRGSPGASTE